MPMDASTRDFRDPDPTELYARYLAQAERGEAVDFAELCRRHPQFADGLRHLHGRQETVDGLRRSSVTASRPASAAPVDAPTGTHRYGLGERLARGGMGVIYKVWDRVLHRNLAMKVVRQQDHPHAEQVAVDPHVLTRFVREAEITAHLDHPGVVPIHDLGLDAHGRIFFTMKLVQGKSLAAVFQLAKARREKWTPTRVVDVIVRVCETVAFAHSRGVIHRDLKPDNIMVGAFGETYVMDWGLAKLSQQRDADATELTSMPAAATTVDQITIDSLPASGGASSGSADTETGCVLGTVWYMPPEQAAGHIDELDERSDIYSVGAILYELLTAKRPYFVRGATARADAVIEAVLAGPPEPVASLARHVPSELVAICNKAMARSKADRYQSMQDMADDLRAYLENRVVRAYQTGAWAELKKWVKRNRGLSIASGASVLVAMAGLLTVVAVQSAANRRLFDANAAISEESRQKEMALEQQTLARRQADAERLRAEGLYLARQAADVVDKNPGQALLLALESHKRHPGFEANSSLLSALASHHELRTMIGHRKPIHMASLSPDRKRLVTASDDNTAIVWDLAVGRPAAWLIGHVHPLSHAEFSPNGDWVVTTSYDNTAAVWDAETGKRLRIFAGHTAPVWHASFSFDSRTLATASLDGTARLWDTETGTERCVLNGHLAEVYSVAFSPDDAHVVSTSADRTARLWRMSTGEQLHVLTGHRAGVAKALFTPDGARIVTAAWGDAVATATDSRRSTAPASDTDVRIWNAQTGQEEHRLEHRAAILSLALDERAERLATGCADGSVSIWDLNSGRAEHQFQAADQISALCFSPDKSIIAAGNRRGDVWLIDANLGQAAGERHGHSDAIAAIAFASGDELITASRDRSIRMWNTRPSNQTPANDAGPSGVAVVASPDGSRFLLVPSTAAPLRLCALPDATTIAELPRDSLVQTANVLLSSDASLIATLPQAGKVRVWSATNGALLATLGDVHAAHAAFRDSQRLVVHSATDQSLSTWLLPEGKLANRLAFPDWKSLQLSPEGRHSLVWNPGQSAAELWSIDAGQRVAVLSLPLERPGDYMAANFSPDGTVLVTLPIRQPRPRLWEVSTGRAIADLAMTEPGTTLLFSDDGSVLLTVSRTSNARTWNTRSGALEAQLSGFEPTSPLGFLSPTGERAVVTSLDSQSRLWDAKGGRMLQLMGERDDAVHKVSFSGDGQLLITLNRNRDRAVLWDARQAERIAAVESGAKTFSGAAFSPRGEWFVTVYSDGSARVWPVSPAAAATERVSRSMTPDERDLYRLDGASRRQEYRLNCERTRLTDWLGLASRMPVDTPAQQEVARAVIAAYIADFLDLLADRAGRDRVAELTALEQGLSRQGELMPAVRLALADAYRNHGEIQRARQMLQFDASEAVSN